MSEIIVKTVGSKAEMKAFVRFNYELYKDSPCAVPDFLEDTLDTFDKKKNPAFEFNDAEWFLALRDGKIVGRVVAIINHRANEIWNTRNVRFGWIDFVDDTEVSEKLIEAVTQWGKERGMTDIVGPLGFTDMDPEGMLFEGFDCMGNMSTIYNYPYYNSHMERLGFKEEAVWVERRIHLPKPGERGEFDKFLRVAGLVEKRYGFRLRKFKTKKEIYKGGYVKKVFDIINVAYKDLYGYSEMTDRQVDVLAKTYLQYLDLRFLSIVENKEGEPIAVGICMGSVSEAIRKAHAKLFPFGWYHMVKGLFFNKSQTLDMLLYGTLPEYRDTGCVSLIVADALNLALELGYTQADVMPQLDSNVKGQATWKSFDNEISKRRHAWAKKI